MIMIIVIVIVRALDRSMTIMMIVMIMIVIMVRAMAHLTLSVGLATTVGCFLLIFSVVGGLGFLAAVGLADHGSVGVVAVLQLSLRLALQLFSLEPLEFDNVFLHHLSYLLGTDLSIQY